MSIITYSFAPVTNFLRLDDDYIIQNRSNFYIQATKVITITLPKVLEGDDGKIITIVCAEPITKATSFIVKSFDSDTTIGIGNRNIVQFPVNFTFSAIYNFQQNKWN